MEHDSVQGFEPRSFVTNPQFVLQKEQIKDQAAMYSLRSLCFQGFCLPEEALEGHNRHLNMR